MNFIKRYWFGGVLTTLICCFVILFVLLVISPKQDAKNRGFVKCTQLMITSLSDCNRSIWCSVKTISENTWCNVKVVAEGVKLWLDNKQPTPWANYLFEPQIIENSFFDEEAIEEYLKNNPDVKKEMMRLDELRKGLENEENNQEFKEEMLPKK